MTGPSTLKRTIAKPTLIFLVALAIGAALAAGAHIIETRERLMTFTDPTTIFGINRIASPLAVQSYDPATRTLLAAVQAFGVNRLTVTKLVLGDTFYAERQDAVLESGVIVGATKRRPATLDELTPGMRGIGVIEVAHDGHFRLLYLLVGERFPLP